MDYMQIKIGTLFTSAYLGTYYTYAFKIDFETWS